MAKKKPLERYVEAGKEFTEASRRRLEGIAHDLTGETASGREHAEDWAEELLERSRKTAEQLGGVVRREIRHQIKQFNRATNQDVVKAVQQFVERTTKAAAPVMDAANAKGDGHEEGGQDSRGDEVRSNEKDSCRKKDSSGEEPRSGEEGRRSRQVGREEGAGCEKGRPCQGPGREESCR